MWTKSGKSATLEKSHDVRKAQEQCSEVFAREEHTEFSYFSDHDFTREHFTATARSKRHAATAEHRDTTEARTQAGKRKTEDQKIPGTNATMRDSLQGTGGQLGEELLPSIDVALAIVTAMKNTLTVVNGCPPYTPYQALLGRQVVSAPYAEDGQDGPDSVAPYQKFPSSYHEATSYHKPAMALPMEGEHIG